MNVMMIIFYNSLILVILVMLFEILVINLDQLQCFVVFKFKVSFAIMSFSLIEFKLSFVFLRFEGKTGERFVLINFHSLIFLFCHLFLVAFTWMFKRIN